MMRRPGKIASGFALYPATIAVNVRRIARLLFLKRNIKTQGIKHYKQNIRLLAIKSFKLISPSQEWIAVRVFSGTSSVTLYMVFSHYLNLALINFVLFAGVLINKIALAVNFDNIGC